MRRARLAALSVLVTVTAACQSAPPAHRAAEDWASGPVRWLLLPTEREALEEIRSEQQFTEFIRRFWRRREDPSTPQGEFLARFHRRVRDADSLYREGSRRGSLTDPGGALVLLGPPPELRVEKRRAPTFVDGAGGGGRPTQLVTVEIWVYPVAQLDARLRALLTERSRSEVSLTFQIGPRRTRLIEGQRLLRLAARAAVADESWNE